MLLHRAGLLLGLVLFAHAGFRDRIQARNKKICKDRQLNQFFRKDGETNCAKVVKCVADRGDLKLIPTSTMPQVLPGAKHPAYLDQPDLWHKLLINFIKLI